MPLAEQRFPAAGLCARGYASHLLQSLGCKVAVIPSHSIQHPAISWARSGLMILTGGSEPQVLPLPLATCADGVLLALRSLVEDENVLKGIRGSRLLTERAAMLGLERSGRTAPGGSCRLLDTADGCIAVNLAREDDWAMLPAWLQTDSFNGQPDDWAALAAELLTRGTDELVERGRLMGLAVAAEVLPSQTADWFTVVAQGERVVPNREPLVIDLSSLWAGPLCSHLLQKLGARVIKVESATRPDGARQNDNKGGEDFYNLLNAGKASVSLDLNADAGRAHLKGLLQQADIVIESARPRGLRQLGIVAEDLIASQPGLTWISITGYGRHLETEDWVGFGDDAGVAAGLTGLMDQVSNETLFVGDAIADPLTGMHSALAAWHSYVNGGGRMISLSLHEVTAHCAGFDLPVSDAALQQRVKDWSKLISPEDIRMPQPRQASEAARPSGADTDSILAEFGLAP